RLGRPGERVGGKPRVLNLEKMKLDLEASGKTESRFGERSERITKQMPRRDWDLFAVAKIAIAQNPPGILRPGQRAESLWIGDHGKIAGAGHFANAHSGSRFENRKHRAVCSVFGQKRAGHCHAAAQRAYRLIGNERLTSQDAMLVRE